jgi:hypothetical protein
MTVNVILFFDWKGKYLPIMVDREFARISTVIAGLTIKIQAVIPTLRDLDMQALIPQCARH